nr:MAG TPA: hypothetical protein [Caudoviricetes sp.]
MLSIINNRCSELFYSITVVPLPRGIYLYWTLIPKNTH